MSDITLVTRTFLFTDIEGSTRLWETYPDAMRSALQEHDQIVRGAVTETGGEVFKSVGDGFYAAFPTVTGALKAAIESQLALQTAPTFGLPPLKVRMALHVGEAQSRNGDYYAPALNRVARLRDALHGGQIALTEAVERLLRQTDLAEGVTLESLGPHRFRDLNDEETVFQVVHPELLATFPPLRSLTVLPNNLPRQLTAFIGRERELSQTTALLAGKSPSRLLTLTGTGGSGKTSLSLQIGAELLPEFAQGVFFVELASLTDPTRVAETVQTTLKVRGEGGQSSEETLVSYLQGRHLLLVLDNCEHLLDACAALSDHLLSRCPHLAILATCREPLGVAGERVYPVPPLETPEAKTTDTRSDTLLEFSAVRLFVERAQSLVPDFALTDANAKAVIEICRRLDGIPLAIVLASAYVSVLSPEQISARLNDRLLLLKGTSRTTLPRHQTLRAAIAWSYHLLSEAEKCLFHRIAVFSGGFTLEAAESICSHEPLSEFDVLDALRQLVVKSLVLKEEADGCVRYRMLETIREYAVESLDKSGEADVLALRHLEHYSQWAEEIAPKLLGSEQAQWLNCLERDHDNLRSALETGERDPILRLRLATALHRFWWMRTHLAEGRHWLTLALDRSDLNTEIPLRAMALNGLGILAMIAGDAENAEKHFLSGLQCYRQVADDEGIAKALVNLGSIAGQQQNYEKSRQLLEEGLARYRTSKNEKNVAIVLINLGVTALRQGDTEYARTCLNEALNFYSQQQDTNVMASILHNLSEIDRQENQFEKGIGKLKQVLILRNQLGDISGIATSLAALAGMCICQGNLKQAYFLYLSFVHTCQQNGLDREPLKHFSIESHSFEPLSQELQRQIESKVKVLSLPEVIEATSQNFTV